jgi:hypothetical protein
VCAGNCRDSHFENRISDLVSGGATPLYDAVEQAAKYLERRRDPEARPVLLLFSDGRDTISRVSGSDALHTVLTTGAQIYSVDMNAKQLSKGTMVLRELSESTGGRYLRMEDGAQKLLGVVVDDLHSGYLLSYALPSHAAGFHSVRILPTHNLNLRFRCRRGYFYGDRDR